MNQKDVTPFNDLLDLLVFPTGFRGNDSHQIKADLLERAIEFWRIYSGHPKNQISFEEFSQSNVFVDTAKIHVKAPRNKTDPGTGTRPILLQPSLIIFLLLKHREKYRIYDIIEAYVGSKRRELEELDFKKTSTGVMRCFTNTRFAANVLRGYGFLKFTRREAYKTWVLSLSGFVVASVALQEKIWVLDSELPKSDKELHPALKTAWNSIDTYEKFVLMLSLLCKPDADIFKTFDGVLQKAYALLQPYWQILKDEKKKKLDRRRESLTLIKTLETLPHIEKFYQEFSLAMNVEKFMTDIGLTKVTTIG